MKSSVVKIACALGVLAFLCFRLAPARAENSSSRIVSAANVFLATLDAKQRQSVLFAFDDEKQRQRWSNFPTGFISRAGISLKEMNEAQRSAAMALLASVLSSRGYEKVQEIMEGDEVNKTTDNGPPPGRNRPPNGNGDHPPPPPGNGDNRPPPPGGNRPPFSGGLNGNMFGKDLYYISILGTPSETNPWILQ